MKVCTACGIEYGDEVLFCQRDGTPLRSADPTKDLVGQVVAERYHVTKKLGEGGMGQVYLAEHIKMGRRCAIKIMSQGMINDPDAVSRFNREAANASRISHPNVCAIYDFGETKDGLIYLAMEFIEGRSLTDLLHETGPLSLPRAAGILSQGADALQAAHDLGIVHRDLKPDNIMVITTRGKDVVKVVDFGIAKATGAEAGQKVTKTGLVVGTPEYMSPEQLSGDQLDGRSDIYSLALVFYRMVTGRLPFKADTAQETMIKRLTDDPMPLAAARPEGRYPTELQRIMDRALARWPNDRYASSAEFGRDVVAAAGSLTGKVDLEGATQVVKAGELKTGVGAVPATRISSAPGKVKKPERAEPAPKKEKKFPVLPVAAAVTVLALGGGAFAAKDALFGPKQSSNLTNPADSLRGPNPGGDTTKLSRGTSGTVTPRESTGGAVGQRRVPAADSQSRRVTPTADITPRVVTPTSRDNAAIDRDLNAILDSIIEVPDRRGVYRSRAEAAFSTSDLPGNLRAKAAATVGQAYFEDGNLTKAREWFVRATALDPKWQRNVDLLDRQNPN